MKYSYKIILSIIVAVFVLAMPVFALEFDVSVDEEIRKKYNPSKLELEGLPPVPNVKPTKPSSPASTPKAQPVKTQTPPSSLPSLTPATQKPIISNVRSSTAIKIKSGTKFTVKSYQGVSDSTRVGTRLSFVSQRPVYTKYVTIPQGTVFRGEVIDSHFPQMTGNGGLVVLSIDSMVLNGSNLGIKAKITKANHRKIFVNNIKGKRLYWKNVSKQVDKGERFYQKTRRTN